MKSEEFTDINGIIARILSKEASSDEIIVFSEWMNESAKNRQDFNILSEFWSIKPDTETLAAEISFNSNKFRFFTQESGSRHLKSRKRGRILLLSIAASFMLLIVSGIYLLLQRQISGTNYIYLSQNDISYITLPDSSKVVLNRNSRLSYSSDFIRKDRKVTLEGEAYFEVEKINNKKFIVQVGNSQVEVLGTKFNINAREIDQRITTTLVEGSILFRNDNQQLLMRPNQQLTLHTQSGLIENVITPDAYLDTEWKERICRYKSISLSELADKLTKHYGIEIIVRNNLKDIKISGTFLENQQIEEVLNIIQNSIAFKWKKDNNKIIIY